MDKNTCFLENNISFGIVGRCITYRVNGASNSVRFKTLIRIRSAGDDTKGEITPPDVGNLKKYVAHTYDKKTSLNKITLNWLLMFNDKSPKRFGNKSLVSFMTFETKAFGRSRVSGKLKFNSSASIQEFKLFNHQELLSSSSAANFFQLQIFYVHEIPGFFRFPGPTKNFRSFPGFPGRYEP
uniref:LAGLIDADG homing endonuclease n=1 Tax=Romanomermis culicivorax TaxID=13658 RepID=A0A915J7K9_ROMCU